MEKSAITFLYLFTLCLLIAGCKKDEKTQKNEVTLHNQITLIFENPPSKWKVYRNKDSKEGPYTPAQCEIKYLDDNFIPLQFFPDPEQTSDTLIVSTQRKIVEFNHSYKGLESLSYIFHPGDTVIFTYNENIPVAEVRNRKTKAFDVNYDLYKRKVIFADDFSSFVKLKTPFFFADFSNGFKGAKEKIFNQSINMFAIEMKKEESILDSLIKKGLISSDLANFYSTKLLYQNKNVQLQSQIGLNTIKPLQQTLTPADFSIQLKYDKELGSIIEENILDSKNDSLLYFSHYQGIINWLYYNYLSRKVGRVRSTNYVNNIATAGSNLPDYLSLCDSINSCRLLSQKAKNILHLKNIQNIIENYSIDESLQAFEKFKKDVADSAYINYVKNKYSLEDYSSSNSHDLRLISTNNEKISFDELLKKHKGKVIYLDFWGSYCAPCIREFEHASKLKEIYKDKNLVQVYISAEPDKKRWKSACKKHRIETESYYVENRYTSRQLESLNIKYFPHYLIYDQRGKLVNDFAPRPSEDKLIKLLDRYMGSY